MTIGIALAVAGGCPVRAFETSASRPFREKALRMVFTDAGAGLTMGRNGRRYEG